MHSRSPRPLNVTEFARSEGPDLLEKCRRFHEYANEVRAAGVFDAMYRIELQGPLDHRILARMYRPAKRGNSYASTRTATLDCTCIRGSVPPRSDCICVDGLIMYSPGSYHFPWSRLSPARHHGSESLNPTSRWRGRSPVRARVPPQRQSPHPAGRLYSSCCSSRY
jgi:hypothetical protein